MNKCGGRGYCPYCGEIHDNVSYHIAQECDQNPGSWVNQPVSSPNVIGHQVDCVHSGTCKYCGNVYIALEYHEANDCLKNPNSWINQVKGERKIEEVGLQISCDGCGTPINQPAGLLFSPPLTSINKTMTVKKFHLCHECYQLACDVLGLDF